MRDIVTPYLMREHFAGRLQRGDVSDVIWRQLEAIQRRLIRQRNRALKREIKAQSYRRAALSGGGMREQIRRSLQIMRRDAKNLQSAPRFV